MNPRTIQVEGELYLSLEVVAETYEVQVTLLREAYDHGLLGRGVVEGGTVCIRAVHLDRVSAIVRMHVTLGLEVDAIELALLV